MRLLRILHQAVKSSLKAGDFIKETRIITQQELDQFSNLSGDHNPIHKSSVDNQKPLVHGAFLNSVVAGLIGTQLPGPGSIVVSQNFTFPSKCFADLPIEIFIELLDARKILRVRFECEQNGIMVFEGEAKLVMSK